MFVTQGLRRALQTNPGGTATICGDRERHCPSRWCLSRPGGTGR